MIKAVIFDLDGTLLNTLEDLKDAVNAALKAYNLPERSLEEVRKFVGNGVRNLMIRAVPDGQEHPQFEEIFDEFKAYYGVHCKDKTKPYDGIIELLDTLKEKNIKMAIVSNKIDSAVKELDKEYFKGYFGAAIGEMEGVSRKPAPDTALKAMKEIGSNADETIYVGDSDVDIKTAINAGISCISVEWGFRDRDFLLANGAKIIVKSPMEVIEWI